MGRQVFTAGEILTAANMNDLSDQTVMVFDDATDRATAIPTPVEGMLTYLEDVGGAQGLEVFDGAVFTPVAIVPDPPAILQVVSVTKTNPFTTSANSFADVPGLSATITPSSATNDIFVTVTVVTGNTVNNNGTIVTVSDGSNNNLVQPDSPGNRSPAFVMDTPLTGEMSPQSFTFLHSPGVTSAFTYKIRARPAGGVATINRSGDDSDISGRARGVSTVTLMEVAG